MIEIHPLDLATTLLPSDNQRLVGKTDPAYWNFTGPFGGFTGGALMRALVMQERIGDPVAMTVNYCAPLVEGNFEIAVRCTRTNKSSQHFSLELSQGEAGISATATAISALRRETWAHLAKAMPVARPPEEFRDAAWPKGSMAWLSRYAFRFVEGIPEIGRTPRAENASARSLMWMADEPRRPLDFVSLMAISDAFFARITHVRGALMKFGTITMTTYFHVSAEELRAEGSDFVLGHADANVFNRGFHDQVAEIWSRSGRPLATTHQVVYYRD